MIQAMEVLPYYDQYLVYDGDKRWIPEATILSERHIGREDLIPLTLPRIRSCTKFF
jgi:hypothetical protein